MSFFPELWLARRNKIVEILKANEVKSVLDCGCGPGAVLDILSSPPSFLRPFPANDDVELESIALLPEEQELNLRKLFGLDLRRDSLEQAIEQASPPTEPSVYDRERFSALTVELFNGSLVDYNPKFKNLDAIFATEVIEHLPEAAVELFAPTLLGLYKPKILIVSTPNHSFNPYFASDSPEEHRYSDPTGRTNRVFRDDDHQFEWTEPEFEEWAKGAEKYGYSVTFDGVGSLKNYNSPAAIQFPPPSLAAHPALVNSPTSLALPNPAKFFATQFATFTRKDTLSDGTELDVPNGLDVPSKHILVAEILHSPAPLPELSSTSVDSNTKKQLILELLQELMEEKMESTQASLTAVWDQGIELRKLVYGDIGELFAAVREDEGGRWSWEIIEEEGLKGADAILITCWAFEVRARDRDEEEQDSEGRIEEIEEEEEEISESSSSIGGDTSSDEDWGGGVRMQATSSSTAAWGEVKTNGHAPEDQEW